MDNEFGDSRIGNEIVKVGEGERAGIYAAGGVGLVVGWAS